MAPSKPQKGSKITRPSRRSPDVYFLQSVPITRMQRLHSERTSPPRSVKRQRTATSISLISPAPSTMSSRSTKQTRDRLFEAIETGNEHPGVPRRIDSADSLDEVQLIKCFEILHGCGKATDSNATLAVTRQSIDGFLDAIFNAWTSEGDEALPKPEMDFVVDAEVVAGKVCATPATHSDLVTCTSSSLCKRDVTAVATYICDPPMFKTEFSIVDSLTGQPEMFCPIGRDDIRWVTTNWSQDLKNSLHTKVASKLHKYNKHLAIWQVRKLIQSWAKGSMSMGGDVSKMGFLGREAANIVTGGLGL